MAPPLNHAGIPAAPLGHPSRVIPVRYSLATVASRSAVGGAPMGAMVKVGRRETRRRRAT